MKQWEDWIIFLGFWDEQYGDAMSAIGKWKESLAVSGLGGDNLHRLSELLNIPHIGSYYSCCLGLSSMRVANGVIEAGWVDGDGLSQFDKEYEKVKGCDFSDTYRYPYICAGGQVRFFNDWRFLVIGMTLNGKPVIDTFKEYGNEEVRVRRMYELGYRRHCEEFLETVRKNYAKTLLPPVPKGILKLPSAFRQGDQP